MQPDPGIVVPDFKEVCARVVDDVLADKLEGLKDPCYARGIRNHSGADEAVAVCMGALRPDILALQGKPNTRAVPDQIRHGQDAGGAWDLPMGSLDYITDDRDFSYLRCYVVQCADSYGRIYRQYGQSILRGSYEGHPPQLMLCGARCRTWDLCLQKLPSCWILPASPWNTRGRM